MPEIILYVLLLAHPSERIMPSSVVTSLGRNKTLLCPFLIGALSQSYNLSWVRPAGTNNIWIEDRRLTIMDYQIENSGTYICIVNVTSPYDKERWSNEAIFYVHTGELFVAVQKIAC